MNQDGVASQTDRSAPGQAWRLGLLVVAALGPVSFEADELEEPLRALAEENGWKAGDLFMAIRVATTGLTATPPLFDTLVALGRDRTLARLDAAIEALGDAAPVGS